MKIKYGADELRITNADETIGAALRSPRIINGLGLPESYKVVDRSTGEEVDLESYPEEGAVYVVEVREQKKNGPKGKPGAPVKGGKEKPAPAKPVKTAKK